MSTGSTGDRDTVAMPSAHTRGPRHEACDEAAQNRFWPDVVRELGGREVCDGALHQLLQRATEGSIRLLEAAQAPDRVTFLSSPRGPTTTASSALRTTPDERRSHHRSGSSRNESSRGEILAEALWAAQHVLGPAGAACCQHLSAKADWTCTWIGVQRRVVAALRVATALAVTPSGVLAPPLAPPQPPGETVAAVVPPLLPLWSVLKGVPGLRSSSPEVRAAAVGLLQDALLALNKSPVADGDGDGSRDAFTGAVDVDTSAALYGVAAPPEAGGGDVQAATPPAASVAGAEEAVAADPITAAEGAPLASAASAVVGAGTAAGAEATVGWVSPWTVCRELACNVMAKDTDPRVAAAALRAVTALLALCSGKCSDRDWRLVAEGVPLLASRARDEEVWGAALAFAHKYRSQAGWRAAVRHIEAQLRTAAAEPEGPLLATTDAVSRCRALAGAAALDAASAGATHDCGGVASGLELGSTESLVALAAGISDAVRHGAGLAEPEALPGQRVGFGACVAAASLPPLPGSPKASAAAGNASDLAGGTNRGGGGGGDADKAEAAALAAAAQSACCSLGGLLGPAGSLGALEDLVSRAELAPVALGNATSGVDVTGDAEQRRGAPGGRLAVSKAGLLAAAAALAMGAAGELFHKTGCGSGSGGCNGSGVVVAPADGVAGARTAVVAHLAVAVRVARLMRRVAALVQDPDKLLFSEVGGAPAEPSGAAAGAARQQLLAVTAGLWALTVLLRTLPAPLVMLTGEPGGGGGGGGGGGEQLSGREAGQEQEQQQERQQRQQGQQQEESAGGRASGRRRPQVLIEELPDEEASGGSRPASLEQQAANEWRQEQQALVPGLLLLCCTFAPPRARSRPQAAPGAAAATAAAAAADPGLPPPPQDVFTPWAGEGAADAAMALLEALHPRVRPQPLPSRALRSTVAAAAAAGAASLALMPTEEVSEQDALAACLPGLVKERIRPIVVQRHTQSLEEGPIRPYTGPDTFTRAVAARRLAWLLMRSRHPFVSEAIRGSLTALLACCDDPAPGVAQYGVAALHAITAECMAADLQWQRELLLEQARRLVVGCQEAIWPLACPAAVALVRRIEGKDPRAPGYHRLAPDLLTEIERQAHVAVRRLAFMPAYEHLLAGLGLTSLRYSSRLMPLLLEWLHTHDSRSRVSALRLLGAVVRATWPRVAAHAEVLWGHLLEVLLRAALGAAARGGEGPGDRWSARVEDVEEEEGPSAEALHARKVCALLLACAREQIAAFQPATEGLAAGAESLHQRLLGGDCGPAA